MNSRDAAIRIVTVAAFALCVGLAEAAARIESFSPTGYTKDVRQVAVRFSAPMVALGDPTRESPFAVDCAVPGTGRWLDERRWVYDFDYDVPGSVRCRFTLRDDVRSHAGEAVDAAPRDDGAEYVFHTGGPAILDHEPGRRWGEIDEHQVFLLALDATPVPDSVREHARCRVVGEESRPVELLQDADRAEVLDALWDNERGLLRGLIDSAFGHLPAGDREETRALALERIVALRCVGALPNGSDLELIWGAGITGTGGLATTRADTLRFSVRPEFRATLECSRTYQNRCLGGIHVAFSGLVRREVVGGIRLVDGDGNILAGETKEKSQIERVDFPAAGQVGAVYRAELLSPFADIDGRALANAASFPQSVRIGRPPPSASFGSELLVVESGDDAKAPVLLHNVTGSLAGRRTRVTDDNLMARWLREFADGQGMRARSLPGYLWRRPVVGNRGQSFVLPVPETEASSLVAGVPLEEPGLHVFEVRLPPADGLPTRYVVGLAMPTDLGAHFHRGVESSLVWVTRLSSGAPVAGADVRIINGCTGRRVARATTDTDGLARFARAFPDTMCRRAFRYLASVRKNEDLALVGSGRVLWGQNDRVHAILDRSLFQPGETVSMKVVVRRPTSDGLVIPEDLPKSVRATIRHWGSGEKYEQILEFGRDASATASFQLPKSAPLGHYGIYVKLDRGLDPGFDRGVDRGSQAGDFRVERFKVGAMRATVGGPEEPLVNPRSVPVRLSVEHLSGGGAASLPVAVRTELRSWRSWGPPSPFESHTLDVVLDAAGEAQVDVPVSEIDHESSLYVELDYRDANGQTKTARNGFRLWPAAVALDIANAKEADGRKFVHVDARRPDGDAAAGVIVEANVHAPRTRENRRLPGGFRGTYYASESPLLASCTETTDADGAMTCEVPDELPNQVFIEASARDADGNTVRTSASRSFVGSSEPRFLEVDTDGKFAVGETVPVRVNLPFADAAALVTVQREGVLEAFVEHLQGPEALVEIPVRRNYVPKVRVSVLAVRGRTSPAKPRREAGMDANAPDYRHDTVYLPVDWDTHALAVRVEPDRESYRVRDRATVRVTVEGPDGAPRLDAEVALIAVDEALLDLWPNPTWNLLAAMMRDRWASMDTRTNLDGLKASLSFVPSDVEEVLVTGSYIRRNSFSLGVAASEAPDSVDPPLRRDFESLLLWRGRLSTGSDGTATVDIPLNDLLTSFRIVAVATAGEDLFGTGEATIRTTQDLVLHGGLPETVREGDRFDAVFTVRNASDRTRRVSVVAEADELGELSEKRLRLGPGRSGEVSWPVTVPLGAGALAWQVTASSRSATDRLAARQTVEPVVPVRVQQATLAHLSKPQVFPVAPPSGALPGRGGVRVSLERSLLGGLATVREAMSRYRFTCIEQRVSVAVALDDAERWAAAMVAAEAAVDPATGLVRFFPSDRLDGSPTLTAYVLTMADAAGKVVPAELRQSMIDGLRAFVEGRIVSRSPFPTADGQLRRLTAMAALARHGELPRAIVDPLDLDVERLPTSGLLDWIDILARVEVDAGELRRAKAILRSRLNMQGTTMGFSTENRDRLWWLMVATDGNAARAILSVLGDPEWHTDAPRMIRGLFGRQQRGRWQTTVANAWGTVAARQFAAVFEADPVTGSSVVSLGEARHRVAWPDPTADAGSPAPVDVPWASTGKLTLDHEGTGTPWGLVQLRAAVPRTEPIRAGYHVVRRVEPVSRESPDVWQRGDVARIELTITADADMTWVVVEDPIPPGAVILGSGLGGDSALLSQGSWGDRWPVFVERDFTNYRAYFRYVPKGTFTVGYSVRYNTTGDFHLPVARVEAMYVPEMFAEEPVAPVSIE